MKNLLKPLSLAFFVAATLPTQSAHIRTSPPYNTLPATGPSSHFCKAIGGEDDDVGYSLIQTSDGGYAIAGSTKSFGAGGKDVYVVKLDAKGNLQWTKTIGGPSIDEGHSLIQTSDGGYAIAGGTNPSAQEMGMSMSSSWMPMVTSNGPKPSAEKAGTRATPSFRPPMAATPSPATPTPSAQDGVMSMSSSWMPMVTSNGPKPSAEKALKIGYSLIQTSDGGYAIAGSTSSFGAGDWDVYVVKLDAQGNLQWTKTIGGKG
jgi:hypothetical protein